MQEMLIDKDAFASGQISSKLWLCRELEKIVERHTPLHIWLFGGWYGVLANMLFMRENINIQKMRSFDVNPESTRLANLYNENWVWQEHKFLAETLDVNQVWNIKNESPDIVINTSTEHMQDKTWFEQIPKGTLVALQSCDMDHEDHFLKFSNLEDMADCFQMSELLFKDKLNFQYPEWSFNRLMLIGKK